MNRGPGLPCLLPLSPSTCPLAAPSDARLQLKEAQVGEQLLWMIFFYFAFHILSSFTFSQDQQLEQPPPVPSLKMARKPQLQLKSKARICSVQLLSRVRLFATP